MLCVAAGDAHTDELVVGAIGIHGLRRTVRYFPDLDNAAQCIRTFWQSPMARQFYCAAKFLALPQLR
jgi:hypothetical protein